MSKSTLWTAAVLASLTSTLASAKGSIYVFESDAKGFNTKSVFYDDGHEVVAFDTQFTPELARQSIDFLKSKTKSPIRYVVVTHPNPDKFNGASVFQKLGAKVLASRATAAALPGVHAYKKYFFVKIAGMFTDETYPALAKPDIVFDHTYDLRLASGATVHLRELGRAGVSSNQTVALIPDVKALIVGDLVHYKAHAWLEGGIVAGKPTPSIPSWIAALEDLKATLHGQKLTVYGGRGEPAPLNTALDAQIAYLHKADALVTNYVAKLGARRAELTTDKAASHFQAIQAEFEKAFPDYKLGYMIGYGVYGLAQSKH